MKKFTERFDIAKLIVPMTEMTAIDPSTLKDKSDNYLELSKHACKRLADVLNMRSAQFSSTLYNTDVDAWKFLLGKRLELTDVKEQIARNNAIVNGDFVVSIDEGDTHIEDMVEAINKFVDDGDLTTLYRLHEKDQIVVLSVNDKGYGVLIHYFMQGGWVVMYDCYYNQENRRLIVAPYKEVDAKIDEDIQQLLDKDQAILTAASTISYQIESYFDRLGKTFMSVEEFCWYMKKIFKIKLGVDKFSTFDYAADHEEITARIAPYLDAVIDKFYDQGQAYYNVNAPYLKRATTMTQVSYDDFSRLLEVLVMDDVLGIDWLIGFQAKCINRDNHFDQLGLGEIS